MNPEHRASSWTLKSRSDHQLQSICVIIQLS